MPIVLTLKCTSSPLFRRYGQQDASEFAQSLLDALHTEEMEALKQQAAEKQGDAKQGDAKQGEANQGEAKQGFDCGGGGGAGDGEGGGGAGGRGGGGPGGAPPGEQAPSSSTEPAASAASAVSRIFGGVLRTTVQCRECRGRSSRTTPFTELSLAFDDDDDGDGNDDGHVDGSTAGNMIARGNMGGEEEGVDVSTLSTDGGPSHKRTKTREAITPSVSTSSASSASSTTSASSLPTSLPAPPPRSLQAMVARYFKTQHLTGDDRYFCEACGRKVKQCVSV